MAIGLQAFFGEKHACQDMADDEAKRLNGPVMPGKGGHLDIVQVIHLAAIDDDAAGIYHARIGEAGQEPIAKEPHSCIILVLTDGAAALQVFQNMVIKQADCPPVLIFAWGKHLYGIAGHEEAFRSRANGAVCAHGCLSLMARMAAASSQTAIERLFCAA